MALERDQQRVRDMLAGEEHETPPGIEDMGKIPVRVRFKLLEMVRQSGIKLAEVFNGSNPGEGRFPAGFLFPRPRFAVMRQGSRPFRLRGELPIKKCCISFFVL